MPQPLMMAGYHEAVLAKLREITWVRDADTYPERDVERFGNLVTPAVYLTVNGWDQSASTGQQLPVELACDLFVVVDRAGKTPEVEKPDIFVRAAAADISQWINGQTFGVGGTSGAVFMTAKSDELDPRMDDYLVWRIEFTQQCVLGRDDVLPLGGPLREVWLGEAPNIGSQHIEDYQLIYKASDDG